ncbi:Protein CBG04476 [Caenorhabditis briggsae]|uniref:Protein CBG04476 n=1 Tax=Caenorhabditis briggsae TaxID=6238 RepID=A8WXT1_CAEBR|nr:Protein CBG04476 [Caenorhabditis briggsae]CAP25205.1 Protein CBG04476 [Caenorhabditis briggsae]
MDYGNKELIEKTNWSANKIGNWFVQRRLWNGPLKETVTEPILENLFQKHQFLGRQ